MPHAAHDGWFGHGPADGPAVVSSQDLLHHLMPAGPHEVVVGPRINVQTLLDFLVAQEDFRSLCRRRTSENTTGVDVQSIADSLLPLLLPRPRSERRTRVVVGSPPLAASQRQDRPRCRLDETAKDEMATVEVLRIPLG